MNTLSNQNIETLKRKVRGRIVLPDDPPYNEVRKIWNAMIDRRPAVIIQCAEAEDVSHAVVYASENGLELSIRGGGHNIAGSALCDGGVMIDLSKMTAVEVDARKRRAYVAPGAALGDFDRVASAQGLATPVGINSTTGIAGLTLGGGFGWLTRQHGLTIDNLVSVEMVKADGNMVHVSKDENADLFWAIRGGGGNFGVVTRFEFELHPIRPEILAGLIVFPGAQAAHVLKEYRDYMASAPEELNVWVVLRKVPPLPFLPEHSHGRDGAVLAVFYNGDPAEGDKLIDPLRGFGNPYGEHVGAMPYPQWQQAFDPLLTPGARNYWKSHNFTEISDKVIRPITEFAGILPSPHCEILVALVSGEANKVPSDATAYTHRDAKFIMNVHGRWEKADQDETCIAWARTFFKAAAPYASGGAYVNFMTADEGERVEAAYGGNYVRLRQIKRKYDPANIFHNNQNIKA